MKVHVASLQFPTFYPQIKAFTPAWQSAFAAYFSERENATLENYLLQQMRSRVERVKEAITVVNKARDKTIPLFFTLPEFFWNIRWDVLNGQQELNQHTSAMLTLLPELLDEILNAFPERQAGKIVLLAGTCAVLAKTSDDKAYEAINYCLTANNYRKTADGRCEKSVWPKRTSSHIDFGISDKTLRNCSLFTLADGLMVKVLNRSTAVAAQENVAGYGACFDNTMLSGCTFSINLCLDYALLTSEQRENEVVAATSDIDFLLACGMPLSDLYCYPPGVKYAVRNDGMGAGSVECFPVVKGRLDRANPVYPVSQHNPLLYTLNL